MLLSIVECSDHKKQSKQAHNIPACKKINGQVEVVGPVIATNVAAMRNIGARASRGEWLFFKDEDCESEYEKIVSIIRSIEESKKNIGAVSGVYKIEKGFGLSSVYNFIQRKWVLRGLSRQPLASGICQGSHLLGGAMIVSKTAFDSVGGFSEAIGWGAEELDFTNRIQEKGYKVGVCFKLKVRHSNSLGLFGFLKRAWFQNFNRGFFLRPYTNKGVRSTIDYLAAPIAKLPPIVLFFFVGKVAFSVGRLGGLSRNLFR